MTDLFKKNDFESVIHFAAKKAVGESMQKPLDYYESNVYGLINLLKVISKFKVRRIVFSSSCTVYGTPATLPVTEDTPFGETPSPYGKTKQMCEQILKDYSMVSNLQVTSLRYFNPVGAHESALIGELPSGIPANLVPFITQTAAGLRDRLLVYGSDYETPDGTAIRDYIHVVDLAAAHASALDVDQNNNFDAFNIGTGRGYSVLEVIKTFEQVSGVTLKYEIVGRREGDVPVIFGDSARASKALNWKAEKGLSDMLRDAWSWQEQLVESTKKSSD